MPHEAHLVPDPSGQETTGIKPTKLSIVIAELKANPDVFYAGKISKNLGVKPIPVNGDFSKEWSETVDIIVSPRTPIFDTGGLNGFMDRLNRPIVRRLSKLFANVKPIWKDSAYTERNGRIHIGRLYYDEPFARIQTHSQRTVTSFDPEATARLEMLTGTSEEDSDEQVWRRIWVRVYPEPMVARILFELESGAYHGTLLMAQGEGLEELVGGKSSLKGSLVQRLKDYYAQQPVSKIADLPTRPKQ